MSDPAKFKAGLLRHLGIDEATFDKEIEVMRRYRDKFLAHLDSDEIMNFPSLEIAKQAVWFYFEYVVQNEAQRGALGVSPEALDAWHAQCEKEALAVYGREEVKETA